MLQGIDHIVIAVPDLEQAINNYAKLGFTVVPGGKHPTGSHNALIAFADGSYVELIAFFDPNTTNPWKPKLDAGMALVDFCMQTDDLQADIESFRRAGVDMSDPLPLSRERPDGYKLDWVLSFSSENRGVLPFLIQDHTPRRERVPSQTAHRNRVTAIDTVTVAVQDVAAVRGWYEQLVGAAGAEVSRPDLNAAGARFTIGPHTFDFVAPRDEGGPLGTWLQAHGPSPYAASLATTAAQQGPLDETLTLGARLTLV